METLAKQLERKTTMETTQTGDVWTPFTTTGWVTCDLCGKQITEGWQKSSLGKEPEHHYCNEHIVKGRTTNEGHTEI